MMAKTSTMIAVIVTSGMCVNLYLTVELSRKIILDAHGHPFTTSCNHQKVPNIRPAYVHPNPKAWNQVGNGIPGIAFFRPSKKTVSISSDGTIVAVGENDYDYDNTTGIVRVYAWNGVHWKQLGSDLQGGKEYDSFGNSVSLSSDGRIVAIDGTSNGIEGGYRLGHVGVYSFDGSDWNQIGDFIVRNVYDFFGHSVSLSSDGSVLAVGTIGDSVNVASVRVYFWNGAAWTQRGHSINIQGVSAYNENHWAHSSALSSDGLTVVVGSPRNSESYGLVRIYHWGGSEWYQIGSSINGSPEVLIGCSMSVSCDGKTIAFGSLQSNTNGQVHVYAWGGLAWNQVGNTITGEDPWILYRQSLSLSCDGRTVVTGAADNINDGFSEDRVRIFTLNGDIWSQVGAITQGSVSQQQYGLSLIHI